MPFCAARIKAGSASALAEGARLRSPKAIARGNRLLNRADRGAYARAPRFVNDGSARGLAGSLLCGFRIGHTYRTQEMVTESRAYRVLARYRQRRRQHEAAPCVQSAGQA